MRYLSYTCHLASCGAWCKTEQKSLPLSLADDIGSGYVSALIYVERCCGEFCC